jgi:hypothetical protein
MSIARRDDDDNDDNKNYWIDGRYTSVARGVLKQTAREWWELLETAVSVT